MECDEKCIDAPDIINWYDKLDVRQIKRGESYKLPRRMILEIQKNENTVFTDVVSKPFLLYSDKVKEAVDIYETKIPYKQIVLLDGKSLLTALYYLPILETVDCLSDKSELNRDGSVIRRAVLDKAKLPNRSIFKLGGVKSTYMVVRLDLAESILRRGVRGIRLKETEIA